MASILQKILPGDQQDFGDQQTFEGFMISDSKKWTDFKKLKFLPKIREDYDVDIETECCGVCGSDVHTITGGWGPMATTPLCVGHEIVGKVIATGPKVTKFKIGQRVGVGAQVQACLQCKNCKNHQENYCPKQVDTYNAPYKLDSGRSDKDMVDAKGNQIFSQGGYSSHSRVHEYFVFAIPDNIPSHEAAPMMCAGLTTYSPLVRAKVGPGKKVAILGIGGLGHFGLLWSKALGAEVYALSHTPGKEAEAKKFGADHFVSTADKNWAEPYAFEFDFILNTADMTHTFDMKAYLSTLNVNGEFHNCGLPDEPLPQIQAFDMVPNGCKISASHIGNREEMEAMLKLASEKNIHPQIEQIKISEAGCAEGVQKVYNNEVRYRVTLVGHHEAFGTGKA